MNGLNEGHHWRREVRQQCLHLAFGHRGRHFRARRAYAVNAAVRMIGGLVELGHVDAGNLCCGQKKLLALVAAGCIDAPRLQVRLVFLHKLEELGEHFLTLTQEVNVEEIHHGLAVEDAAAATHNDGEGGLALSAEDGDAGQVQHGEHVGIGHLPT